jgi:hypothetical protein
LATVKQMSEQLSAMGHRSAKEIVGGLTRQHSELVSLVKQQQARLQQAIKLRRQYAAIKADLETCLRQCKEQAEGVAVNGVTTETRLHRHEVCFCFNEFEL